MDSCTPRACISTRWASARMAGRSWAQASTRTYTRRTCPIRRYTCASTELTFRGFRRADPTSRASTATQTEIQTQTQTQTQTAVLTCTCTCTGILRKELRQRKCPCPAERSTSPRTCPACTKRCPHTGPLPRTCTCTCHHSNSGTAGRGCGGEGGEGEVRYGNNGNGSGGRGGFQSAVSIALARPVPQESTFRPQKTSLLEKQREAHEAHIIQHQLAIIHTLESSSGMEAINSTDILYSYKQLGVLCAQAGDVYGAKLAREGKGECAGGS
jgi:hypothetical protein